MIKYQFRDGPVPIKNAKKANPQKLGEAYEKAGRDDGVVHDQAKNNPKHPWHSHLEWDDSVCGRLYRIDQIRYIARILCVVPEEEGEELFPAFISLVADGGHRARYSPSEIIDSVFLQTAALSAADRDLLAFQRRHAMFTDLCQDVEAVRMKIRARMGASETTVAA